VELVATIVLAFAAVGTAWSSYQAARWNGQQAIAASRANAARFEASRAASTADANIQIDVATFIQWIDATATEQSSVAEFYRQRFRPEFKPAFDAWLTAKPLTNPEAPSTPFATPEYQLAARADAAQADARAQAFSETMRRNVQRATNYVLAVVLFAVALFFAGMSTKLTRHSLRVIMVTIAAVVLLGTAVWVATSPISVSV
jgi:hypothetical protein